MRHRDFLKLWSAETISQFGTQISLLAIPLIAILAPPVGLGATPFQVGLLGAVEPAPAARSRRSTRRLGGLTPVL